MKMKNKKKNSLFQQEKTKIAEKLNLLPETISVSLSHSYSYQTETMSVLRYNTKCRLFIKNKKHQQHKSNHTDFSRKIKVTIPIDDPPIIFLIQMILLTQKTAMRTNLQSLFSVTSKSNLLVLKNSSFRRVLGQWKCLLSITYNVSIQKFLYYVDFG